MGGLKLQGKPSGIPEQEVRGAYQKVKADKGAPGVGGVALAESGRGLKGNLYEIWNRMRSGSYFPPPVEAAGIPGARGGGVRVPGVPAVAGRIARTVAAARLEKAAEPVFHRGSCGYRPRRGALDAVAAWRERCRAKDRVIGPGIREFSGPVPRDLIVRAVEAHASLPWVLLYVKRWPAAPVQQPDGTLRARDRGTPRGSAASPVPASLFMHYASGMPMAREFPACPFGRYAGDAAVRCAALRQAREVPEAIAARMEQAGLSPHPGKTKITCCKDGNRRGSHERTSFLPAVSRDALAKMSAQVRRWRLHPRTWHTTGSPAREINPVVRGRMQYHGVFCRSALLPLLRRISACLMRWLRKKYKRLRPPGKARACRERVTTRYPRLFARWARVPYSWWSG